MTIDRQDAAAALDDIDSIAIRVRQTLIYQQASLVVILWGVLTSLGYFATFLAPALEHFPQKLQTFVIKKMLQLWMRRG